MKTWTTKNGYKITQVLAGRSNVFLLSNEEKNILIDTSPKFMWKRLQNRLRKLNINKIDYLILTHTHFDHAANSKQIKEKYGAKVIVHKNEEEYLLHGDNVLPSGTNPISKLIARLFVKPFTSFGKYEPCKSDIIVDSIFSLNDMGFNGIIMHTPGHSPGSISIIVDDEIALVGDTMFGVFRGTVYPPFAGDTTKMINSWGSLLETNSRVFLPSHGSSNPRSLVERDYKKRANIGTKVG
jgi:glyoxylase-like metal-dependent hydrolase (beta-lactamase superfamily II)